MTPPTQTVNSYNYENSNFISLTDYNLVDSLKSKFIINDKEAYELNDFLWKNNDSNNQIMNLLFEIHDKIMEINKDIVLSLHIIKEEYYIDEFLRISYKTNSFDDSLKIDDLEDNLVNHYSIDLLDKIMFFMEF